MGIEIKEELLDIEGIKKSSKPLLDLFIRRTAVVTQTSETLTDLVVKDQWRRANKLTQAQYSVAEFDFCNLGIFYLSKNKAKKRISKLEDINAAVSKESFPSDKLKTKKEVVIQRNLQTIKTIKFKTKQLDNLNLEANEN